MFTKITSNTLYEENNVQQNTEGTEGHSIRLWMQHRGILKIYVIIF